MSSALEQKLRTLYDIASSRKRFNSSVDERLKKGLRLIFFLEKDSDCFFETKVIGHASYQLWKFQLLVSEKINDRYYLKRSYTVLPFFTSNLASVAHVPTFAFDANIRNLDDFLETAVYLKKMTELVKPENGGIFRRLSVNMFLMNKDWHRFLAEEKFRESFVNVILSDTFQQVVWTSYLGEEREGKRVAGIYRALTPFSVKGAQKKDKSMAFAPLLFDVLFRSKEEVHRAVNPDIIRNVVIWESNYIATFIKPSEKETSVVFGINDCPMSRKSSSKKKSQNNLQIEEKFFGLSLHPCLNTQWVLATPDLLSRVKRFVEGKKKVVRISQRDFTALFLHSSGSLDSKVSNVLRGKPLMERTGDAAIAEERAISKKTSKKQSSVKSRKKKKTSNQVLNIDVPDYLKERGGDTKKVQNSEREIKVVASDDGSLRSVSDTSEKNEKKKSCNIALKDDDLEFDSNTEEETIFEEIDL